MTAQEKLADAGAERSNLMVYVLCRENIADSQASQIDSPLELAVAMRGSVLTFAVERSVRTTAGDPPRDFCPNRSIASARYVSQ